MKRLIIILVLVCCFGMVTYASYDSEDDIPIAPQTVLDYAINVGFEDFVVTAHYRNDIPEYTVISIINRSFVNWDSQDMGMTYQMWGDVRVHKVKIVNGLCEPIDTNYYGRSMVWILPNGELYNNTNVFGDRGWGRMDYSSFDIVYTDGTLIRKAGYTSSLELNIIPTNSSIDIVYANFSSFDSIEIEVYEYDFRSMGWNQDTKEVFVMESTADGTFKYAEGVGNKFDSDKYYGFEVLGYKNDEITYRSNTLNDKYKVLTDNSNSFFTGGISSFVRSPIGVKLANKMVDDKKYYFLSWGDHFEHNYEIQIKETDSDFVTIETLTNDEHYYLYLHSDAIEAFRIRSIMKEDDSYKSDWVVVDKNEKIVYIPEDYYYEHEVEFKSNSETHMKDMPKQPTGINPIDYIKYVFEVISWYISFFLSGIKKLINQIGQIPQILQQIVPFLPVEVTLMLSVGVAVSIILRIFGRK